MKNTILKKKKKNFFRYKSINQKKLKSGWRKPKGIHNKVRLKKKGHPHKVSIGYGTKKELRNYYNSIYDYKLIKNLNDLDNLDKKYILISKSVGLRKKIEILNRAKDLNLNVIRVGDVDSFLKKIQDKLKENKQKKEKKKQKKEVFEKKAEEKIIDKKELTPEEKIEKEKEEKKKVLESK